MVPPVGLAAIANTGWHYLEAGFCALLYGGWTWCYLQYAFGTPARNLRHTVSGLMAGIVLVDLLAVAGGAHVLEQDYYLYVLSPDQLLPWLRLVPTVSRAGQELRLGLAGIPGQSWTIQASTNLAQWSDLTNVLLTNRTTSVLVPVSPDMPARYFRGR